jgi:predicted Na+-dependent transporter
MTATGVVGVAAVVILAYDVLWSVVHLAVPGLRPGLDIALTVVGCVIPFVIGAVLARWEPPSRAMVLTAVVGVVDSTLGWAISWWIGPGRTDNADEASVALTIVMVVAVYAVIGLAGAAIGRRWMRQSARAGHP